MENIKCIICESDESVGYLQLTDRLSVVPTNYQLVKCKCNFVYLNPRPTFNDISSYYQSEKYDPHYTSNKRIWTKFYHFVQFFTLRWKYSKIPDISKTKKLLDIGAGQGEFATFMREKGWNVVIQDTNKDINQKNNPHGYNFVQELKQINESESFNVITLWHSLEHIHNVKDLYHQINRLLAPGGVLLIAVPNLQAPERKSFGVKWAAFDAPRHLYHFHPDSIKKLCIKYNFKIIRKFSLFQDSPYNILLSISNKSLMQLLRAVIILFMTLIQSIIRGPDYSSSFLVICKKY